MYLVDYKNGDDYTWLENVVEGYSKEGNDDGVKEGEDGVDDKDGEGEEKGEGGEKRGRMKEERDEVR
jgi:hypothetical protein